MDISKYEYYRNDLGVLYNCDCLDILPYLEPVDLVLTDPPYGINLKASENGGIGRQNFEHIIGDNEIFDPSMLLNFNDCILWGCNHYCHKIPPLKGQWYFWDKVKMNGLKLRIAEGEFAWHKLGTKPRAYRHLWSGAYRDSESGVRSEHPTQKPIDLFLWCMSLSNTVGLVLDPFLGSGTTAVACERLKRRWIGIEIEEKYCAIAKKRIEAERKQLKLF